jgi:hypothetical protein
MKPRAIEVYIEELILHGFDPSTRWNVRDAVENELRGLLAKQGIPSTWHSSPERIEAGPMGATSLTKPAAAGEQIARAVYGGGDQ